MGVPANVRAAWPTDEPAGDNSPALERPQGEDDADADGLPAECCPGVDKLRTEEEEATRRAQGVAGMSAWATDRTCGARAPFAPASSALPHPKSSSPSASASVLTPRAIQADTFWAPSLSVLPLRVFPRTDSLRSSILHSHSSNVPRAWMHCSVKGL